MTYSFDGGVPCGRWGCGKKFSGCDFNADIWVKRPGFEPSVWHLAGDMATEVACEWAGAVIKKLTKHLGSNSN